MKFSAIVCFLITGLIFSIIVSSISGCAQIGAPTGGAKDTIPPHLLKATPELNTVNFSGNKLTFTFDEYVEVKDVQNNVLFSPYPKINPQVDYKLKTVTVKLKDSLLPNTTYSIDFGKAIQDVNEANPLKHFTYVFSTGPVIDTFSVKGNVILAETGKVDSTILVLLYRNADDSSVQKRKPDYLTKLDGEGKFSFTSLPAGDFKIYALKDGNGSKTYDSPIEAFAFLDKDIIVTATNPPITLNAFAEEKDVKKTTISTSKQSPQADKKLKYGTSLSGNFQDLLTPLEIKFTHPLKDFNQQEISLTDTSYQKIGNVITTIDSSRTIVSLQAKWKQDEKYRLIITKDAFSDSADNKLTKTDTLRFSTKKESDYGSLLLRFTNVDTSKHPVLQFVQNNGIVKTIPISATAWSDKLFIPGEYELRILYDSNNNGQWDPGNYSLKQQPEKAVALDKKLSIRANWDNERDIQL